MKLSIRFQKIKFLAPIVGAALTFGLGIVWILWCFFNYMIRSTKDPWFGVQVAIALLLMSACFYPEATRHFKWMRKQGRIPIAFH